jgi:hypothetical protein
MAIGPKASGPPLDCSRLSFSMVIYSLVCGSDTTQKIATRGSVIVAGSGRRDSETHLHCLPAVAQIAAAWAGGRTGAA